VNRGYLKILRNRKRRIQRRLNPKRRWNDQAEPILKASNIHYEMAEKARAVNCGGIGAIHLMVNKLGLRQEIDSRLPLLKKHLPYHESDHVLNLTYNALLDESGWRTLNCGAMMRPSSMVWAPNASRTRRPAEISLVASRRTISSI
jgi:hypothetical protein